MNRLQRYLLVESARTVLLLLLILLAVAMSTLLADALAQVARGRIGPDQMLFMMGLNTLEATRELLPLSLFLGLVLALTRMAQDREWVVMQCSGFSPLQALGALSGLVAPLFLLLLLLSLWVVPWADRMSDKLVQDARTRMGVSTLQPGRFRALPGGGVIYLGAVEMGAHRFRDAFIYRHNAETEQLITARSGVEKQGAGQNEIVLEQGWHLERQGNSLAWKRMHFDKNRLFLPAPESRARPTELENVPLDELMQRQDQEARVEVRARLAASWSVWVLLVLALPLSRLSPRTGRYGRIAMALLLYVLYANLAGMARLWFERGVTPAWMGLEWLHLLVALLSLAFWLGVPWKRSGTRSTGVTT